MPLCQALHRSNFCPICLNGKHETTVDCLSIQHDGATSAYALFTTHMRARQTQIMTKDVDEEPSGLHFQLILDSIHFELNGVSAVIS